MQTRHLLLLLSLGAVQLSRAAYQLQWETPSPVTAFVNYNTALTGTLMSDEDCENETYCKPIGSAEVSLTLAGLGLLSVDPYTPPPPAPVAAKGPASKAGKAKPLENSQGNTPLNVTTNEEGRFVVHIWSDAWGTSTVNATSVQNDSTLEAGELAVNWVTPTFKIVVEPAALDDTAEEGRQQTVAATLLVGEAAKRRAAAAEVDFKPLAGQNLTFYRLDTPFPPPERAASTPAKSDKAKRVIRSSTVLREQFGDSLTDQEGKATATLTAPAAPGSTVITVEYVDAFGGLRTSDAVTVNWWPAVPVPVINASTVSTTPGNTSIITVTVTDSTGAGRPGVNVTFDIQGGAQIIDPLPSRKSAPGVRDTSITVPTNQDGVAQIILFSQDADYSTVTASYTDNNRVIKSDPITVTWEAPQSQGPNFSRVQLFPRRQQGPVRTPIDVTALILDDAEQGVEDVEVHFTINPANRPERPNTHKPQPSAQVAAGVAAVEKMGTTNADGKATVTLENVMAGEFRVVASAVNSEGTLVSSRPVMVRWYNEKHHDGPKAGYPKGGYPKHNEHPKSSHGYKKPSKKHGHDKKRGGRRYGGSY